MEVVCDQRHKLMRLTCPYSLGVSDGLPGEGVHTAAASFWTCFRWKIQGGLSFTRAMAITYGQHCSSCSLANVPGGKQRRRILTYLDLLA